MNKYIKVPLVGLLLLVGSSTAAAEWGGWVGVERDIDAKSNDLSLGASAPLPWDFAISGEFDFKGAGNKIDMEVDNIDFNVTKKVGLASFYADTDLDNSFEWKETSVGIKFKF